MIKIRFNYSKKTILTIINIFFILIGVCFFVLNRPQTSQIKACDVVCTDACIQYSGGCDEPRALAGCGYGLPDPASGYSWCCHYKLVNCCEPGECTGCTPSCPSGSTTTVTGPKCKVENASCKGSNGCSSCTVTGATCYTPETNTEFMKSDGSTSGPASITMIVNGFSYQLSTDPNNPTIIKLPYKNTTDVQISVPSFTPFSTADGGGYYFQVNNYGIPSDGWGTWVGCSGTAGEDFCHDQEISTDYSANVTQFTPTSQPLSNVIKQGASGKVSVSYYTNNVCDDGRKSSTITEGYYLVDTLPIITPAVIDTSTDKTAKQCTSTTYTGKDINNPLHFRATVTDSNGSSDIQGFIAWFSKDSSVPTIVTISGTTPNEDVTNDMGIFIRKNGTTWTNPYIYGYDSTSQDWERASGGSIQNKNGETFLKVENVSVTTGSTNNTLIFDFYLELLPVNTNPQGMYNLYSTGIDNTMINSNKVDMTRITSYFAWGFDLVDPSVSDIIQTVLSEFRLSAQWGATDSQTSIKRAIVNAYRIGGTSSGTAELFIPSGTSKGVLTLTQEPTDLNDIGRYDSTSSQAWVFANPPSTQTDTIEIRNNAGGKISLYVTAYDQACNTNSVTTSINLNPWFATRGGLIYSNGGISSQPVDVSGVTSLNGVFKDPNLLPSSLDLGTEILMSKNQTISSLVHSLTSGAVRAYNTYDSNDTKNYWYDTLKKKFDTILEQEGSTLTSFNIGSTDTKVSSSCTADNCYMYSASDISIPSGYVCDRRAIFISDGNINIDPDITSSPNPSNQNISGCIFLAKNNIVIGAGTYKSTSNTAYDYIDGVLIADNQIIFSLTDQDKNNSDGIEIGGSLIAFGSNTSSSDSAISLRRNLGLYNQTKPTLVLSYNNKYTSISQIFFGKQFSLYKQEVGFKSF